MPEQVAQDFLLSELAKVFNEEGNLSKLSAFFYFVRIILPFAASSRTNGKTFKLISVIQLSNNNKNRKGTVTFKSLLGETCVTAPKTILDFL